MDIQEVASTNFRKYGRVIHTNDFDEMITIMKAIPIPDKVIYEASFLPLEETQAFQVLRDSVYGGLPIQAGYCSGDNHTLDAVEYHCASEVNIACTDLILLLGMRQDIEEDTYQYNTSNMEAFLVKAGITVELYATTLHYAPISSDGKFCTVVILPRGTNCPLPLILQKAKEDRFLFAQNKWLLAHPESGLDQEGTFLGLSGKNITI